MAATPSSPRGPDPRDFFHPNAPAGGCGPGNGRVPGTLCAANGARPVAHVDAPGGQAHWYDDLPGVAFTRHVMAVFEAIGDAHRFLPRALLDATGMELHAILAGILPSLVLMVAILALTTTVGAAAGAALGALAGGVGAIPGAAAGAGVGLEVGTVLLEWLGLAFLVVYIGKSLLAGTKLAASAVALAWHSTDQPQALRAASMLTASRELADAVALVFRGVLQGLVAFLLAKGVAGAASRVPELVANLRKSRLGGSFATWVEKNWAALVENPKLKEKTQVSPSSKPAAEPTTPSAATRERAAPVATSNVYRVDGRPPGTIFNEGFQPRGTSTDLESYVNTNNPSAFVSTSKTPAIASNPDFAKPGSYLYEVDGSAIKGIDVNKVYPANPFAHEAEIAVPGGISPDAIISAKPILPGGGVGNAIPNPFYKGGP